MKHVLSYVAVAALLVGCGPSLNQVARTTQAFAVQQRCSQGPFEIHVPAFGSKWGEDVTLEARGGAIDGHSTVTIDGTKYDDRTFSNGSVNNAACMLSDADRAAAVTGGNPVTMPDTSTHSSTTTNASMNAGSVALVPAGVPNTWVHQTQIAKYHYEVTDLSGLQSVLKRGQDIAIVFWSERPIDLQATTFVVVHSEMVAPDGDAKWQAHLEGVKAENEKKEREAAAEANKKQLEAEAEAKKQRLEAEAKWREEARCRAAQGADKKCHDEGYKTGAELVAYAELQRRCEDLARKNATDQVCRDDGWRNENERPESHEPPHVTNLALSQPAPPMETKTQETKTQRAADRPPPAPQAETQPPKPSEHAEWIPGSWQWNGTSDWVWLGGGWRVPEQDRAQHLTATAPSAPPAVRVEAPSPQPIASAVWAPGYWHWNAGQWIWVPGHWAVPPRAGATWRPSTYVREGVQLRLDPGGWILR